MNEGEWTPPEDMMEDNYIRQMKNAPFLRIPSTPVEPVVIENSPLMTPISSDVLSSDDHENVDAFSEEELRELRRGKEEVEEEEEEEEEREASLEGMSPLVLNCNEEFIDYSQLAQYSSEEEWEAARERAIERIRENAERRQEIRKRKRDERSEKEIERNEWDYQRYKRMQKESEEERKKESEEVKQKRIEEAKRFIDDKAETSEKDSIEEWSDNYLNEIEELCRVHDETEVEESEEEGISGPEDIESE